jgi:hypothetical protein
VVAFLAPPWHLIALDRRRHLCRIRLHLLDETGKKLGTLPTLETAVLSRAPAYDPSTPDPNSVDAITKVTVYR